MNKKDVLLKLVKLISMIDLQTISTNMNSATKISLKIKRQTSIIVVKSLQLLAI